MKKILNIIKREFRVSRITKYSLGMISIALGVSVILKSNLGNSSWDTLHWSMHKLTGMSVGTAMFIVAAIFITMVIMMEKKAKYLFMLVPVFIVSMLVDFSNNLISIEVIPDSLATQIVLFTIGLLSLPLGGAFMLISTYPAGVFDEFMMSVMRKLKSDKLITIRVIMELTAVTVAFVLGQLADIGLGKISYGTLIFSLSVGVLVKIYLNLFERIGLVENKQID